MMLANKIMLWSVAVMAVAFVFFGDRIMGFMNSSDSPAITADMTKTVLSVEGMT